MDSKMCFCTYKRKKNNLAKFGNLEFFNFSQLKIYYVLNLMLLLFPLYLIYNYAPKRTNRGKMGKLGMARNRSVLSGFVVPLLADLMCQRTLLRQWVCVSPSSAFTSGASPKETACSKN